MAGPASILPWYKQLDQPSRQFAGHLSERQHLSRAHGTLHPEALPVEEVGLGGGGGEWWKMWELGLL